MSMINAKIRTSTYLTEKELIKDFELMFNNARHYNEENSQVLIVASELHYRIRKVWSRFILRFNT